MLSPKRLTTPAPVVSLEEAKKHARVFFQDDDDYITSLITAAETYLDGYTGILGRCMASQEWATYRCAWDTVWCTPMTDTTTAVVQYYDADEVLQTVDETNYIVYADSIYFRTSFIRPVVATDRPDTITLKTTHGMGVVPESLKLAIKTLVAYWWTNRIPVSMTGANKVPFSFDALVAPWRRDLF